MANEQEKSILELEMCGPNSVFFFDDDFIQSNTLLRLMGERFAGGQELDEAEKWPAIVVNEATNEFRSSCSALGLSAEDAAICYTDSKTGSSAAIGWIQLDRRTDRLDDRPDRQTRLVLGTTPITIPPKANGAEEQAAVPEDSTGEHKLTLSPALCSLAQHARDDSLAFRPKLVIVTDATDSEGTGTQVSLLEEFDGNQKLPFSPALRALVREVLELSRDVRMELTIMSADSGSDDFQRLCRELRYDPKQILLCYEDLLTENAVAAERGGQCVVRIDGDVQPGLTAEDTLKKADAYDSIKAADADKALYLTEPMRAFLAESMRSFIDGPSGAERYVETVRPSSQPAPSGTYSSWSTQAKILALFCGVLGYSSEQIAFLAGFSWLHVISSGKLLSLLGRVRELPKQTMKQLMLQLAPGAQQPERLAGNLAYLISLGKYDVSTTWRAIECAGDILAASEEKGAGSSDEYRARMLKIYREGVQRGMFSAGSMREVI